MTPETPTPRNSATEQSLDPFAFIETVHNLTEVMDQEVTLLNNMKIHDSAPLQDRKATLVNSYESSVAALKDHPDFLNQADETLRVMFKDALTALNRATKRNATALDAAKTAHERLMQAVSKAMQQKTAKSVSYSRAGQINRPSALRPGSVHVNHCL